MSLVFALGCSGGVLAIEAVFSLDVIDECLKHRVSVPEHRRGPEMVAHFRLDLADRHYVMKKGRVSWSGTSTQLRAELAENQRLISV